jgi:hypothetical protein
MANICGSGLQPAHGYYTKEAWYGAAMNAWQTGVDGIYTFNLFPTEPVEQYNHIGAPDTLKGLDKVYAIDPIEPRDFWGFDRAALVVPDRLPITLLPNGSVKATLPIGEDIAANAPEGKTAHAVLRIRISAAAQGDQLRVTLNGTGLGIAAPEETLAAASTPTWFQVTPPPQGIHPGDNQVEIRLETARTSDNPIAVDRLELNVNYQSIAKP